MRRRDLIVMLGSLPIASPSSRMRSRPSASAGWSAAALPIRTGAAPSMRIIASSSTARLSKFG